MAQISAKEKENESRFMTLFWRYIKDTYEPEDSSEYWESVVNGADEIYKQYSSNLDRALLMAYIDWLEQKHKAKAGE